MKDPIHETLSKTSTRKKKIVRRMLKKERIDTVESQTATSQTSERIQTSHLTSNQQKPNDLDPKCKTILSKKDILVLLNHLFMQTKFSISTYYIALEILTYLECEGSYEVCIKVAGTLLLMASKMNQTVQMPINFILEWSSFCLKRQDIIATEATILDGLDYQMPEHDFTCQEEMIDYCRLLERQILDSNFSKAQRKALEERF